MPHITPTAYAVFILVALVGVGVFVWVALPYFQNGDSTSVFVVIGLVVLFLIVGLIMQWLRPDSTAPFRAFAEKNSLQYELFDFLPKDAPTYLTGLMGTKARRNILSGAYQNIPFEYYTFVSVINLGRDRHTVTFSVCKFAAKNRIADLILEPAHDSPYSFIRAETGMRWSGLKSISLEGQFGNYFNVFAPLDGDIPAREVLAPDVMLDFIERGNGLGFEWFGSSFYVYNTKEIKKEIDLSAFVERAFSLAKRFVGNSNL